MVQPFYVTGGTLRPDASSYVTRQADEAVYQALSQGRLCYVLTSRQMGKSSLMVRAAWRLRDAGSMVVVLDLTAIGQNITVDQWYEGLLSHMGRQLLLEDEIEQFSLEHPRLGPLQRWTRALTDVILPRCEGRLVIFIDEIDCVHSLPFATGEFFAGIRELHNRRAEGQELSRLSFCLLGVASPSDLIRDTRTTPFNIGERIELHDFTESEADVLAEGLEHSDEARRRILRRILSWTGGHPYLTQRFCQAVAKRLHSDERVDVDAECAELFFSARSQLQDDNLLFVRERLLRSEADRASLLTEYDRVLRDELVSDNESQPLVEILKLSGVVRSQQGRLVVRNRIYRKVFGRKWVTENLPDAELRRQKSAYRKGILRAATIGAAIIAVVAGLAVVAMQQRKRAERQEIENRRLLYAARIAVAHQNWKHSDVPRIDDLLEHVVPEHGQEDLRGFEWYYLWNLCCTASSAFAHADDVRTVAFSPDSTMLASGSSDRTIKLWDMASGRELATLRGHTDNVLSIAFSPDGKYLASASSDHTIKIWDVIHLSEKATLVGHDERVLSVAISPDGATLASSGQDRTVKLWALDTGRLIATLEGHQFQVWSVAFSPDGKTVASASWDGTAKLWDVTTAKERLTLAGHADVVTSVAFSPDGNRVATASYDRSIKLWNIHTGKETATLSGSGPQSTWIVAFSPSGRTLATGGALDHSVRLWDVASGRELGGLAGHASQISALAFSPDGRFLASGGADRTVKLWDTTRDNPIEWEERRGPGADVRWESLSASFILTEHSDKVSSLAFSPNGGVLASGGEDGLVILWDATDGHELASIAAHEGAVHAVAFTPASQHLVSSGADHTVKLWAVATRRELAALSGHTAAVRSVAVAPDGRTVASGSDDRTLKLWDIESRQLRTSLEAHGDRVASVAFSPDGKMLATAGSDRTVKLWDVKGGELLSVLTGYRSDVHSVAFSPDGTLLASGSADSVPKLWDVATGNELATVLDALSVAFSPDGKTLASGTWAGAVKLWSVQTRQELITLEGHTAHVPTLAFSPDGRTLATGSSDGTIRLWRGATEEEPSSLVSGSRELTVEP